MKKNKKNTKPSMWALFKRQRQDIRRDKQTKIFWAIAINTILAGSLPVLAILLPMQIIDNLSNPNTSIIFVYIAIFAVVSLVFSIAINFMISSVRYRAIAVRMNRFIEVNKKSITIDYKYMEDDEFLDKTKAALSCLDGNGAGYEGIIHKTMQILPLFFSAILYVVIVGAFAPWVIIACFIGAGLSIMANTFANQYAYKQKEKREHTERKVNYYSNVAYDFTYGKDIRMYDLKDKLKKDFRRSSNSYLAIIKDIQNHAFGWAMFDVATLLLQDGLAYYFIIVGYFAGAFSLGTMSAYIGAVIGLTTCLKAISKGFADLNDFTQYMGDFYAFLDDKSLFSFSGNRDRLISSFSVEFKDVSFKYPRSEVYAIQHLNLKIAKGEKLALVGANGAGKTTLVKLLTGLFVPNEGTILIDGIDIKEFKQAELQAMFGVVFQDFTIYASSVLENIMGADIVGESKALSSLKMVGLEEKIKSLPKKEKQPLLKVIDDDGMELSGGENQKLAIARALYKDANMIILDEPTSALDALAEEAIYRDFDGLVKGKTAIYVSHRLSSTKFCDHIALLSSVGLAEYGTHEELMALKGQYYHMFVTQGKYYQNKEGETNEKL